jgi:hypothetical protein
MSTDVSEEYDVSMFRDLLHVGFSLGLSFDPEDGGNVFVRNVC